MESNKGGGYLRTYNCVIFTFDMVKGQWELVEICGSFDSIDIYSR